jgi:hypothetical protein
LAVVFKPVVRNFVHLAAPLRRFGASPSARLSVLVLGLTALTAYTVPELQRVAGGWLSACLWSCLGYFAIDAAVRAHAASQGGKIWSHICSFSGFVDVISADSAAVRRADDNGMAVGVAMDT